MALGMTLKVLSQSSLYMCFTVIFHGKEMTFAQYSNIAEIASLTASIKL